MTNARFVLGFARPKKRLIKSKLLGFVWISKALLYTVLIFSAQLLGMLIFDPLTANAQGTQDLPTETPINFNQDVRGLLAAKCLACHGPDEEDRQADLRLDTFEGATDWAIVPGDPDSSEFLQRIISDDDDLVMPPASSGKQRLTAEEIETLRNWISQGAEYQEHWSLVHPTRPSLPQAVEHGNEVDAFVQDKLQAAGLSLSEPAQREVLARRVALDLTGLPPQPQMLAEFLNDAGPDAYQRYVQKLMDMPAFGEHWATAWLDLARYADTDGYADDNPRTIWPYRDWVIQAINSDLPFDQFTIQQLAGDLMPNANETTRIATGFHRNTLTNNEGGTIDEEFRVEAVKDRVDTTMQVWNGLTFGCAKCHSHKYDPISQVDYYQLYAIFNQTADSDRPGNPPFLRAYALDVADQANELASQIEHLKQTAGSESPQFREAFAKWKATWDSPAHDWKSVKLLEASADNGTVLSSDAVGETETVVASGPNPVKETFRLRSALPAAAGESLTAIQLDIQPLPYGDMPGVVGRSPGNGNFVISEVVLKSRIENSTAPVVGKIRISLPGQQKMIHLAEVQAFDANDQLINLKLLVEAKQSSTDFGGTVDRLIDGNIDGHFENGSVSHTAVQNDPWVEIEFKQPQAISKVVLHNRLDGELHRRLDGVIVGLHAAEGRLIRESGLPEATRTEMTFAYDGWRQHRFAYASADFEQPDGNDPWTASHMIDGDFGRKGWAVAGQQHSAHQAVLQLADPIDLSQPTELMLEVHQNYGAQHTLSNLSFRWTDALGPNLVVPDNRDQAAEVFARSKPLGDKIERELANLEMQLSQLAAANSPVMEQLPRERQRESRLLVKGSYLSPGEMVEPRLPEHLADDAGLVNRQDLAQWLVSDENPLTARVTVNRIWARLFGRGIVETEEDFGMMGTQPSHPELLDWLAVYFADDVQWSRKQLIRKIVLSRTYRQTAVVSELAEKVDPENRLLSRAPRYRLSAEQIRDQALMLAGLLNRKMFGPSVVPRLPVKELGSAFSGRTINESTGADLYRRGLYTYVRRTGPYPTVLTFDGTNRQVCTVRRIRTNTPLQALVTLNDPVYFEAAQGLARRILTQQNLELRDRMAWAFKTVTCRSATEAELDQLIQLFQQERQAFAGGVSDDLLTNPIGLLPESLSEVPREELAAWTIVANVLLNLDEVLTR